MRYGLRPNTPYGSREIVRNISRTVILHSGNASGEIVTSSNRIVLVLLMEIFYKNYPQFYYG